MGAVLLRETKEQDIEAIRKLYSGSVGADELRWALLYPLCGAAGRSFVASTGGKVIGHAGFVAARYIHGGSYLTGAHPVFWIVDPECRGKGIGMRLMQKALGYGDFSFIIGGEPGTRAVYPRLNLRYKFHVREYCRVIDAAGCLRTLGGPYPVRVLKLLALSAAALAGRPQAGLEDVRLDQYDERAGMPARPAGPAVCNAQEKTYIKWLLDCPAVFQAHAFTIVRGGKAIGGIVTYIGRRGSVLTGRIVDVSYLGRDEAVWSAVLKKAGEFFKEKGCAVVSTLASHPDYIRALQGAGYISTNRKGRPFFLADLKGSFGGVANTDWHLTFAEGDMGYRGM